MVRHSARHSSRPLTQSLLTASALLYSDGLDTIPSEVVVEKWLDLSIGNIKTKRTIGGQILVRFIRTSLPVR